MIISSYTVASHVLHIHTRGPVRVRMRTGDLLYGGIAGNIDSKTPKCSAAGAYSTSDSSTGASSMGASSTLDCNFFLFFLSFFFFDVNEPQSSASCLSAPLNFSISISFSIQSPPPRSNSVVGTNRWFSNVGSCQPGTGANRWGYTQFWRRLGGSALLEACTRSGGTTGRGSTPTWGQHCSASTTGGLPPAG